MKSIFLALSLMVSLNCFGLAQGAAELLIEASDDIEGCLDSKLHRFIVILESLEQNAEDPEKKVILKINLDLEVRLIEKTFNSQIKQKEMQMQIFRDNGLLDQNYENQKKELDKLLYKLKLFRLIAEQALNI